MTEGVALGEVQSLVAKAARGAGRPFGVAEDAGRAARWLSRARMDGSELLARLLDATDGVDHGDLAPRLPALEAGERALCPLILGAYLSDTGVIPEGPIGPVLHPIVLAPVLADLAGQDAIHVQIGTGGFTVVGPSLLVVDEVDTSGACVLRITRTQPPASETLPPLATRAQVTPDTLARLTALAARTYAPATEASRVSGAGAGQSDND